MRQRVVRWGAAAAALAAVVWVVDAGLRAVVLGSGTFAQQFLSPSLESLLVRVSLIALGAVVLLSLHSISLSEAARVEAVAERRRLCDLYDYTTDAIVLLDRDLRIVFMNRAAERIGGKRLTESVGWQCYRAIMGRDEPCAGCGALDVFETGHPKSATKYETTDVGRENWLEQHWYPARDDNGDIVTVIEVAKDITDVKMLEREVAALHKMLDARRRGVG